MKAERSKYTGTLITAIQCRDKDAANKCQYSLSAAQSTCISSQLYDSDLHNYDVTRLDSDNVAYCTDRGPIRD
jgi:hypothetical protein